MKNKWRALLGLLAAVLPLASQAQFTYTTNADDTLTITGYTGGGGAVDIPDMIDTLTVSMIGTNAFADLTNITSVTMPSTINNIEDLAFAECSGLTNIAISDNATNIGNAAFIFCSSLPRITIPSSVSTVGIVAFQACTKLTNAAISSGVGSLGDDAFDGCAALMTVTVPASVTNLGQNVFANCRILTNATLVNGLANIGPGMFEFCQSLGTVTIPASVTNIGGSAFFSSGLTSVTIPPSVTTIGSSAFALTLIGQVTIPSTVTNIAEGAFAVCTRLTTITVAASNPDYSSLNGVLFDKAQDMILAYPASLTGNYPVPASVTDIGGSSFEGCSLSSLTFSAGVTNIEDLAFADSTKLATLLFYGNAPAADPTAFEYDTNVIIYYYPNTTGWISPFDGLTAVPVEIVTWSNPASVSYGAPLGSNQLNAAADVPGSFLYTPAYGSVLNAGTYTLSAIFVPSNAMYYTNVTNTVSLAVSPVPLSITASNAQKTYGIGISLPSMGFFSSGLVNSDIVTSVTLTSSGTAASAPVSGSPYLIVPSSAMPASLTNNYVINYANGELTVNPAVVTIASGVSANNKTYDGTTAATLGFSNVMLQGVVSGDTVSLGTNAYTANFASPNVGSGIPVIVSGLNLSGASSANYSLMQPANLTADIFLATPPILHILLEKPYVVLSWPTNAFNYTLEQAPGLYPGLHPSAWAFVTNSITITGTNNTVTITAGAAAQYFELTAPE